MRYGPTILAAILVLAAGCGDRSEDVARSSPTAAIEPVASEAISFSAPQTSPEDMTSTISNLRQCGVGLSSTLSLTETEWRRLESLWELARVEIELINADRHERLAAVGDRWLHDGQFEYYEYDPESQETFAWEETTGGEAVYRQFGYSEERHSSFVKVVRLSPGDDSALDQLNREFEERCRALRDECNQYLATVASSVGGTAR